MGNIPEHIVNEIKEKAALLEVVNQFVPMSDRGASRNGTCPLCSGKKKFTVTPAKDIWKCFSCNVGGKGAVSFLMKVQNKDYVTSLRYLADMYKIHIEEEVAPLKQKAQKKASSIAPLEPVPHTAQRRKPKADLKTFRDQQLAASGLTDEDQRIEIITNENTKTEIDRYISGTLNERYEVVSGDDMVMRYVTLDSKLITFMPKSGKKERDFYRMRWQYPENHLDKDGKPMKYQSPAGSGSKLWLPSAFVRLYQSGKVFETVFFHEGEKKADKAQKHGMDSIGIMGIHNLANNNRLPHEVEMVVKRGTKNVVFVVDSDFRDLGHNREKSASARVYSFMKAVYNFQQQFFAFNNSGIYLNIYFAYVKKNKNGEKGIDDLLAGSMAGKEAEVARSIFATMNLVSGEGAYLDVINITDWSLYKFQEFFHLQNVQAFGEYYYNDLKDHKVFRFGRELWRFSDEGKQVELAQPLGENEKFWDTKTIHRQGGKPEEILRFNWMRCYAFLFKRGFARYKSAEGKKKYVFIDRNIVTEVEREEIKSYITEFSEQMNHEGLMNMIYSGGARYFSEDSLSNLKFIEPKFQESQKNVQYMFFSNCYWKITQEGIQEAPVSDLDGYVWKNQIAEQSVGKVSSLIGVIYEPTVEQLAEEAEWRKGQPKDSTVQYVHDYGRGKFHLVDQTPDGDRCHFLRFLLNTSDFFKEKTMRGQELDETEEQECIRHFLQKCTAFGYLLHTFHDPRVTKAVIAMDAKLSEVGASEGRSGKSLLGRALQKLLPTVYIPGKAKDLTEDRFLLEEVQPGRTKVLWIDDVRVNFDMEFFFPFITGGAKFETKGIRRTTLPIEQTPKLYICTNHAINEPGGSFASRMIKLAFSDWYFDNGNGHKHSPIDDFGVSFFDEWDADQWNLFYNFAAFSLQTYFKYGIIPAPNDRLEKRRLRQFMGEIFLDFCNSYFANPNNINHKIPREEFTNAFYEKHGDQRKVTDIRKVKQKLAAWCSYRYFIFNPGYKDNKGKPNGGDCKSGGVEYFIVADEHYAPSKDLTPDNSTQGNLPL